LRDTVASLIVTAYHVAGQGQTIRAYKIREKLHEAAVRILWPASETGNRTRPRREGRAADARTYAFGAKRRLYVFFKVEGAELS